VAPQPTATYSASLLDPRTDLVRPMAMTIDGGLDQVFHGQHIAGRPPAGTFLLQAGLATVAHA